MNDSIPKVIFTMYQFCSSSPVNRRSVCSSISSLVSSMNLYCLMVSLARAKFCFYRNNLLFSPNNKCLERKRKKSNKAKKEKEISNSANESLIPLILLHQPERAFDVGSVFMAYKKARRICRRKYIYLTRRYIRIYTYTFSLERRC